MSNKIPLTIFDKLKVGIHLKELLKGGSASFVFQVFGKFLGFLFAWLTVRYYGDTIWGQLAFSISVITILKNTGQFGFHSAIIKVVSEKKKKNDIDGVIFYYIKTLSFVLPLSVFLSLLIYLNADWVADIFLKDSLNYNLFLRKIVFAVTPMVLVVINGSTLRGLKKIARFSFIVNCLFHLSLTSILFICFLFLQDKQLVSIATLYVLASIIAAVVSTILTIWALRNLKQKADLEGLTATIKEPNRFNYIFNIASPLFISSFSFLALNWSDSFFIGYYCNDVQVGIYNVIVRYGSLILIGLNAINAISAPKFSEFWTEKNMLGLGRFCKITATIGFLISAPIVLFFLLFPNFLLGLFGDLYIEGTTTFYVITIGFLINSLCGSVGFILMMTNKQKVYRNILLIAVVINLSLDFILIPRIGILGAGIANCLAMSIWNISSLFYIYKHFGLWVGFDPFFLIENFKKILTASK